MKALVAVLLAAAAAAAQSTGTISGSVRAAGSRRPIENVQVSIPIPGADGGRVRTITGAQGQYSLTEIPPGQYRVYADAPGGRIESGGSVRLTRGASGSRAVTLAPGQTVDGADFYLASDPATIEGRVLDENQEPVAGIAVTLIASEYEFGTLRYAPQQKTVTNDNGEYLLTTQARYPYSYLIRAGNQPARFDAISGLPKDRALRGTILRTTYYPGSPDIEGAMPVEVRASQHLTGMDIRMAASQSFCMEAVLRENGVPSALEFEFSPAQPTNGLGSVATLPRGKAGANGKVRICDLSPGQYRLTAWKTAAAGGAGTAASTLVGITDSDVHDVVVDAAPGAVLSGRIRIDDPVESVGAPVPVRVQLFSLTNAGGFTARTSAPGDFRFENVFRDDFGVRVAGLPQGQYVRSITFGGLDVLGAAIHFGTAPSQAEIAVTVAKDGGSAAVSVRKGDGSPVPDAFVYIFPDAVSEPALAARMIEGQTDAAGQYLSATLPPGRYYAVATLEEIFRTPAGIHRLSQATFNATRLDAAPLSAVRISLQPVELP